MIEMKGKLSRQLPCMCCDQYNFKKINLYKDKSYLEEAYGYFYRTHLEAMPFHGVEWFDKFAVLFKDEKSMYVSCDHPTGEDVVFINNKFAGYLGDWYEMIDFCEKSGFKFTTHKEVRDYYMENIYDYD